MTCAGRCICIFSRHLPGNVSRELSVWETLFRTRTSLRLRVTARALSLSLSRSRSLQRGGSFPRRRRGCGFVLDEARIEEAGLFRDGHEVVPVERARDALAPQNLVLAQRLWNLASKVTSLSLSLSVVLKLSLFQRGTLSTTKRGALLSGRHVVFRRLVFRVSVSCDGGAFSFQTRRNSRRVFRARVVVDPRRVSMVL